MYVHNDFKLLLFFSDRIFADIFLLCFTMSILLFNID